jgi:hypothetical protein
MNPLWANDEELFDLARRELFTAVVGDVMDKLTCVGSSCRRKSSRWTAA